MRVHFAVVLALFSLITNAALADTTWVSGGSVSGSWNRAGSPYMLMSGIDIPAGATLSIGPGVTIVFMVSFIFGISNGARLEAMGAEGDSIYFTADTLLNPERWEGLWILGNADTCRMEYCVLEYAATPGYGTCLFEGPTVIRNTTFRHNSAGYGVVLYSYHTDLDLSHCTFEHNTAGSGGVFYVREARGMIHDCLFRANRATDNGGVFQFESQHAGFLVQNCDFIDNTATGNGGSIYLVVGDNNLAFNNCRFIGNHAGQNGGAVGSQVNVASARFDGCIFEENQAEGNGGALQVCHSTIADHCLFANNRARNGGAIYAEPSSCNISPAIQRCTIAHNTAAEQGGGIYLTDNAGATVHSSVVAFNQGLDGIRIPGPGIPNPNDLAYNAVYGNEGQEISSNEYGYGLITTVNLNRDSCDLHSNILLDPLFADMNARDYHLTAASPCIDAGDPALEHDPDGTVVDMGAFYYPHTIDVTQPLRVSVTDYRLEQNYPNPFNAQTRITFAIPQSGNATLQVFDLTGRLVRTLVDGMITAGTHEVNVDASALPSGMYIYRLQAGDVNEAKKMLLLK